VNTFTLNQLAELELHLSELVHPDWLSLAGVKEVDSAMQAESSVGFSIALSRHMIEAHKLVPLREAMFSNDWTYAILGGHNAVRALSAKLTTYLIATWVQGSIDGTHSRALHTQLGNDVYKQALRHEQPLKYWIFPKEIPLNLVQFLKETAQTLLNALWMPEAPSLSPWATLMSAPHISAQDDALIFEEQEFSKEQIHSTDLLSEINQRLNVDFETDIAGIIENSSSPVAN
jgi:hypothetical protein